MQIGQTRSLVKTVELMNKPFISIPFYKLNSNKISLKEEEEYNQCILEFHNMFKFA